MAEETVGQKAVDELPDESQGDRYAGLLASISTLSVRPPTRLLTELVPLPAPGIAGSGFPLTSARQKRGIRAGQWLHASSGNIRLDAPVQLLWSGWTGHRQTLSPLWVDRHGSGVKRLG